MDMAMDGAVFVQFKKFNSIDPYLFLITGGFETLIRMCDSSENSSYGVLDGETAGSSANQEHTEICRFVFS